jgi:hypothetical protein
MEIFGMSWIFDVWDFIFYWGLCFKLDLNSVGFCSGGGGGWFKEYILKACHYLEMPHLRNISNILGNQ